ncbi:MAG TPA: solute carrier family 23 protein [Solirubrobacteraceae bacterium]|nr:solute carrier family 23 protein [Solirubrobacteraceae bacterium]
MVLWKVHGDGKHVPPTEVVAPEERLAWPQTIGLGAQHVLAMFGATFIVPVLIGFPPNTTIFFSGIGTMIFLIITIGRGQRLGLPSYLGSSFAFIAPVIAAKAHGGIPAALAGICIAGAVFFLVGAAVNVWGSGWIQKLMPPVVTGTVVALIGLNLASSAFANYSKQPWCATTTIVVIILAMVMLRGFLGRLSILIGVVAGYLVALAQGLIHFSSVNSAGWLGWPTFYHPSFSWRPIGLIVPVVVVLIAENTGHIKAVATMTNRNLDKSLGRGFMGDGLATMIAGLNGGSGTTTYAENIGVMAATRVYSTAAYWVAAVVAICFGLIPKFGALVATLPAGVLGGAGTVLYGMIVVLGGRIWVENRVNFMNPVNLLTAAVGLILGAGNYTLTFDHGNIAFSGIATGAIGCILVYQVMEFLSKRFAFRDNPMPFLVPMSVLAHNAGGMDALRLEMGLETEAEAAAAAEPQKTNGKAELPGVTSSEKETPVSTNGDSETPAYTNGKKERPGVRT